MAGTITAGTLSDGSVSTSTTNCIQGSAKAWVNFNGVTTATIRASYNVSSVTRNSTGDYTVNFATAMPDANYSWNINSDRSTAPISQISSSTATPTSSAFRFFTYTISLVLADSAYITAAFFR